MDDEARAKKLIERRIPREDDQLGGRTQFFRDYTAIIHSKSFRRLRHKTQVFFLVDDDIVCTRNEHALIVSSIAATVASSLELDKDLALAIGIGHDIGHPPFGHAGEQALQKILEDDRFCHELHGLRVADNLEQPPNGLNLTYAVRDGIAHHCGEDRSLELQPNSEELTEESLYDRGVPPATLEGCIVRLSDRIGFIGRDMVDAIHAKIIKSADLPWQTLRKVNCEQIDPAESPEVFNSRIVDYFVRDLITTTGEKGCEVVGFSPEAQKIYEELYDYSKEAIYRDDSIKREIGHVEKILNLVYAELDEIYNQYQWSLPQYLEHVGGVDPGDNPVGRLGLFMQSHASFYDKYEDRDLKKKHVLVDFIAQFSDDDIVQFLQDLIHPKSLI